MKKCIVILSIILGLVSLTFGPSLSLKITKAVATEPPKLAIVIDDFGEDRRGVEEMLSLKVPLTCAILPGMDYSIVDAETAHKNGHEVILHMPMENRTAMPASYYGPVLIKNAFTEAEAIETLNEAIQYIPHIKGMNIHMGTGVSSNKVLMRAIMSEAKKKDLYFLDSKTIEETVCPEVSKEVGVKFYSRDFFLEPNGRPNYYKTVEILKQAVDYAVEKGSCIVIGHIGPVGEGETAKAILDTLSYIELKGVKVVPLSEL